MKSKGTATWNGDLFNGSGTASLDSGAAGPLPVSWASRTEAANGKTSPEELIAAAHAACYSMAFSNILAGAGFVADQLDTTGVATFEDRRRHAHHDDGAHGCWPGPRYS